MDTIIKEDGQGNVLAPANYRWQGPDTDIRHKPAPNQLDAQRARRKSVPEPPLSAPTQDQVARLAYCGIPQEAARRIVALEAQNFLLEAQLEAIEARLSEFEKEK